MAIKFESIQPGETLLDVHSQRMGNTTMREMGVWEVRVLSVDTVAGTARVSWNGNPAQTWYRIQLQGLRRFAPEWLRHGWPRDSDRIFYCHHCNAQAPEKDSARHKPTCPHPKAVAYRKRNAA